MTASDGINDNGAVAAFGNNVANSGGMQLYPSASELQGQGFLLGAQDPNNGNNSTACEFDELETFN